MKSDQAATETIDAYIAGYPSDVQEILERIRSIVKGAAPHATEAVKYGLPTFVLNRNLVHFGAFKSHIGLYPAPSGISAFEAELAPYRSAKGSVRFPLDEPMPYDLIRRIVEFRVAENVEKSST